MGELAHLDGRARRHRAEVLHAHIGVLEELLDVGHVGVGLDDVVQRGAGRGQGGLDVLAGLLDLRPHVALAHHVALPVPRELAGDEDRLPRLDHDDVGVERVAADHPLGELVRLDILSLHAGLLTRATISLAIICK